MSGTLSRQGADLGLRTVRAGYAMCGASGSRPTRSPHRVRRRSSLKKVRRRCVNWTRVAAVGGRPARLRVDQHFPISGAKKCRRQPRPGLGDPNPGVLAIHYPNSADA